MILAAVELMKIIHLKIFCLIGVGEDDLIWQHRYMSNRASPRTTLAHGAAGAPPFAPSTAAVPHQRLEECCNPTVLLGEEEEEGSGKSQGTKAGWRGNGGCVGPA
jgi:hypothetical protein